MKRHHQKISMAILTATSIVYIGFSIDESFKHAIIDFSHYTWQSMALSLLSLTAMTFVRAYVHRTMLLHIEDTPNADFPAVESYLLSQIIRYIPGKVVGVAAQSIQLSGKPFTPSIWITNLLQYTATNYNAITVIAFSIASIYWRSMPPLFLGMVISFSIYFFLNYWWVPLSLIKPLAGKMTVVKRWPLKKSLKVWFSLQLEWVFFLTGIALLSPINTASYNAIILGILYSFSSIVASLTLIMPSGLLVRESIFIWISSKFGFHTDSIFVLSIMLRIFMTFADVSAYTLFMMVKRTLRLCNEQ